MKIEEHIENALEEMAHLQLKISEWAKTPREKRSFTHNDISVGTFFDNRAMSPKGAEHLWKAAAAIRKREGLDTRLSVSTVHRRLNDEISHEIERLKNRDKFSLFAIVKRTAETLHILASETATYIFPTIITGQSYHADIAIGAVHLLSRDAFQLKYGGKIDAALVSDIDQDQHITKWQEYTKEYSYFIAINTTGFEDEMGREAAREAAEWFLNLIRLRVGWRNGPQIRLAGAKRFDRESASLKILGSGEIAGRLEVSWQGAILKENWSSILFDEL